MFALADTKLKIASKPENIALVERMVDDVCKSYKVNEDHYGNVLIALTEAVNNAINHGNKLDESKFVEVVFQAKDSDTLIFTVKDEGNGFDFNNLPDPTDPERIAEEGGRGVFLIRNLADKVEFSDKGRMVAISFDLKKTA